MNILDESVCYYCTELLYREKSTGVVVASSSGSCFQPFSDSLLKECRRPSCNTSASTDLHHLRRRLNVRVVPSESITNSLSLLNFFNFFAPGTATTTTSTKTTTDQHQLSTLPLLNIAGQRPSTSAVNSGRQCHYRCDRLFD